MADDIQATRRASASVFGNEKVAEIVACLGGMSAGVARLTDLVDETRVAHGMIRPVLTRLVDAGVLVALPRQGGARGQLFYEIQTSHPAWWPLLELAKTLCASPSTVSLAPAH